MSAQQIREELERAESAAREKTIDALRALLAMAGEGDEDEPEIELDETLQIRAGHDAYGQPLIIHPYRITMPGEIVVHGYEVLDPDDQAIDDDTPRTLHVGEIETEDLIEILDIAERAGIA